MITQSWPCSSILFSRLFHKFGRWGSCRQCLPAEHSEPQLPPPFSSSYHKKWLCRTAWQGLLGLQTWNSCKIVSLWSCKIHLLRAFDPAWLCYKRNLSPNRTDLGEFRLRHIFLYPQRGVGIRTGCPLFNWCFATKNSKEVKCCFNRTFFEGNFVSEA